MWDRPETGYAIRSSAPSHSAFEIVSYVKLQKVLVMFWGVDLFKEDISSEEVSLCHIPVAFSTWRLRYLRGILNELFSQAAVDMRACCEAISFFFFCYLLECLWEVWWCSEKDSSFILLTCLTYMFMMHSRIVERLCFSAALWMQHIYLCGNTFLFIWNGIMNRSELLLMHYLNHCVFDSQ